MVTLPVEDAQRAMGLCRRHASDWGIDPARVGILGFSAGANLAGHAAWDRGDRGFGMMQGGQSIDHWPARVAEWLSSMGLATVAASGRREHARQPEGPTGKTRSRPQE
jgi:acetyl esterase/lipase